MFSSRGEFLLNQSVTFGFRHIFAGSIADVDSIIDVKILGDNFAEVYVVQPGDVTRVGLGSYQVTIPAGVLNRIGKWYDVWSIKSIPTSSVRSITFESDVVLIHSPQAITYPAIIQCRIEDLDACMLKKQYLWPVWSVLSNGYYLPDGNLQYAIDTAISYMQRHLGISFKLQRVRTPPYQTGLAAPVLGQDYDEQGTLLDWQAHQSQWWSSIRLPRTDILRIRGLRGVYGGQVVYQIPDSWIDRNDLQTGWLRIRPTTAGSIASIIDGSGRFLDVTLLEGVGSNFVPGFWAVDYDYGPANDMIAKEICDVIMKKAAITILDQLGMAISKGISSRSASVDGLSSSIGFVANAEKSMFGALAARYEQELSPENLMDLRRFYKGPSVFIF